MATAAILQPQEKPIERVRASIHRLLQRGIRLAKPATLEEIADRGQAIQRLEEDASSYYEWKQLEDQAKKEIASLKPVIQAAIDKLGAVPDSAPKSRRAETKGFVCTTTTGSTMEIDDDTVLQFDLAMNTKPLREIFDMLFVRRVEYTLSSNAHQMMQHGKLPPKYAEMIHSFYSRSFKAKTTLPSLTVESKAALEEKRREAIAAAEERAAKKKSGKVAA